jgi:hypothetical protein
MTKKIILIGNGESRLGIEFNSMPDYKIGCNAAYRDFKVDCVVAVDRRVIVELLENNFKQLVYTRPDWIMPYPNIKILPDLPYQGDKKADDPWHWGTGPHSCNVAASMNPNEVHLYGFDLWGVDNKINNVYKDTKNYDTSERGAIDPRFWIYQLAKCFELYPNIQWIQHQPSDWKKPESWNFSNLSVNTLNN